MTMTGKRLFYLLIYFSRNNQEESMFMCSSSVSTRTIDIDADNTMDRWIDR
jgi:hypothetical protein